MNILDLPNNTATVEIDGHGFVVRELLGDELAKIAQAEKRGENPLALAVAMTLVDEEGNQQFKACDAPKLAAKPQRILKALWDKVRELSDLPTAEDAEKN